MGHSKSVARSSSQPSGSKGPRNGQAQLSQKSEMIQKSPMAQVGQTTTDNNLTLMGKVFAITGGASGIGLATAKVLSKRGATVCIADVDQEAMEMAEAYFNSLDVPYMITKVDVSKRKEVDSWIESIVKAQGRLDGAANVAGVIRRKHGISTVAELEDEEWDRIIAINLTGTMYCMRAELQHR